MENDLERNYETLDAKFDHLQRDMTDLTNLFVQGFSELENMMKCLDKCSK